MNEFMKIVKQVIKMPFLNGLKQFMLKLLRNNLYLGTRAYKVKNPEVNLCYLCNDHRENQPSLFLGCEMFKKQVQFIIRVLIKAGFLQNGHKIDLFIFENYDFNSIEIIALVTLWKFVYNTKFDSGILQGIPFMFWLKKTMSQLTALPPPL